MFNHTYESIFTGLFYRYHLVDGTLVETYLPNDLAMMGICTGLIILNTIVNAVYVFRTLRRHESRVEGLSLSCHDASYRVHSTHDDTVSETETCAYDQSVTGSEPESDDNSIGHISPDSPD
jgi:hypothetical protein